MGITSSQNVACNLQSGSPDKNKADAETMDGTNDTVTGTDLDKPKSSIKSFDEEKDFNGGLEKYSYENSIVDSTFFALIERMKVHHYSTVYSQTDAEGSLDNIITKCKLLFERDYNVVIVENNFTDTYPRNIIIPLSKKNDKNQGNAMSLNVAEYSALVTDSIEARLRSRFVVPAILIDNKFICRSASLTVYFSACYERIRSSVPTVESLTEAISNPLKALGQVCNIVPTAAGLAMDSINFALGYDVMEPLFVKDERILKFLGVGRICDLMVEYNKCYRQAVNVSSTEKVYEVVYKDMKIEEMPYPGCEFFTKYNEAGKIPEGLVFDWSQDDVTRTLKLTEDPKLFFADMDNENSKEWDLVKLTRNYLKIILSYIVTETDGILVHCISGWDRTTLFVSLIRLSLWADGIIHQSLGCEDMAYLTVAYDWYLFGHNLPDRLYKKEEVMHFCFNFLKYITSDEFSVTRMFQELPQEKRGNRSFPEFVPERRECLNNIRNYVLEVYDSHISASKK